MADWKVSREKIELSEHPNADKLEIAKLGLNQAVVQKGQYKNGDVVIFIPEKSLLPNEIAEPVRNYLSGPAQNRVRGISLRGVRSCGLIITDQKELSDHGLGEDISTLLNITKYEPPIPPELSGKVRNFPPLYVPMTKHDVEQFHANRDQFVLWEHVQATEKVHGSQVMFCRAAGGESFVSSKGLLSSGFHLEPSDTNSFWRAVRSVGLIDIVNSIFDTSMQVQVFGELIPVQKGFTYGFKEPTVKLFDLRINGDSVPHDQVPYELRQLWVPILYEGPFGENLTSHCEGMEQVSGKELHIREGCVIRPVPDRYSAGKNPFRLMLKVINPKYAAKETGEEIS